MQILLLIGALLLLTRLRLVSPAKILIQDGDSVWISRRRCRVTGYDAPEWDQPGGSEARQALRLAIRGPILVILTGKDIYGRTLVRLFTLRGPVASRMVLAGHGYPEGTIGWMLSLWPRIRRKGFWGTCAIPPALWRQR